MPSSSLGGTVIEIRVPRRMWDPESEWEGWGTVVRVSRHKETSLMGTGPAATAQKRLTDMSVIRYVPFFFSFLFFFSWTWWWVRSQSLFNSGLTVPMKHSHHTHHYFSSIRSLIFIYAPFTHYFIYSTCPPHFDAFLFCFCCDLEAVW